jgi:hypothetical protein
MRCTHAHVYVCVLKGRVDRVLTSLAELSLVIQTTNTMHKLFYEKFCSFLLAPHFFVKD